METSSSSSSIPLSDFDYHFDSSLIAITPMEPRSGSRLMRVQREGSRPLKFSHRHIRDLPDILEPSDVVVFNQSPVLTARFMATKKNGGIVEGLFLEGVAGKEDKAVRVWIKGRVTTGEDIRLFEGPGVRILEHQQKESVLGISLAAFLQYLKEKGNVALPPYIRAERKKNRKPETTATDKTRYQTIFAKAPPTDTGYSVAAPTASLHFDEALLEGLKTKGIQTEFLSLHVGRGTFEPLEGHRLEEIKLHREWVEMDPEAWERIQAAKNEGRRVIAVGSTSLRALESMARKGSSEGYWTDLFIKPPFEFKVVNGLLTNFHWPRSSLLVLVATFLGSGNSSNALLGNWRSVYDEALKERYRLFSYGDACLIL